MNGPAADVAGRIVVFAGPSIPPAARPIDGRLVWRGPAAAGDTLDLGEAGPAAVLLIDGLFDATPAVRHKELLQLMAHGVPVIGAASMGALRAAELAPFGMIGVGSIFGAYARGALVGDDEVAVLHGPEETGWTSLTEPMVNVRATALAAVRRRVIAGHVGRFLLRAAKSIFYKERTWPGMLATMAALGRRPAAEARALAAWLPGGRVDLKRADALAGLRAALTLDGAPRAIPPFPPQTVHGLALAAQVAQGRSGRGART